MIVFAKHLKLFDRDDFFERLLQQSLLCIGRQALQTHQAFTAVYDNRDPAYQQLSQLTAYGAVFLLAWLRS